MSRVYPMSVGALFHFFMVLCLGARLKAKPLWIAAGLDAVEKENELKHPLALTPCVWEGHTQLPHPPLPQSNPNLQLAGKGGPT